MAFAVCVTYQLRSGTREAALKIIEARAETSLEEEEHCLQFDILSDAARPNEVLLFEMYSDEVAFREHRSTRDFKAFESALVDMVVGKSLKTYRDVR